MQGMDQQQSNQQDQQSPGLSKTFELPQNLMGVPLRKKSGSSANEKTDYSQEINRLTHDVSEAIRRLRVLEERNSNMRKKVQLIENDLIESRKKFQIEFKTVLSELDEVKDKMHKYEENMSLIIKEIQLSAKKEDVDIIKKYLEYWEPVKFVTTDHVEKIIEEKFEEKLGK